MYSFPVGRFFHHGIAIAHYLGGPTASNIAQQCLKHAENLHKIHKDYHTAAVPKGGAGGSGTSGVKGGGMGSGNLDAARFAARVFNHGAPRRPATTTPAAEPGSKEERGHGPTVPLVRYAQPSNTPPGAVVATASAFD